MRRVSLLLAGSFLATSSVVQAANQLNFGKPPAFVVEQAIPTNIAPTEAPIAILSTDQQVHFEPGKRVIYTEIAMKVQKPEGLSAGNISIPWDPATDTVTVNKLEIRRGAKAIDVLASQKFSTMRRETGLEAAMLDGVLTANIQPEGLQEGDVIILATTIEHSDPVFGNHVETNFAEWPDVPIGRVHVRMEWPASMKLSVQAKGLELHPEIHGSSKVIEISAQNVQPVIPPKDAPARYAISRLGEATDYASWADLARATLPLYRKAATIPATGPLHDELEKIRASTADPKLRAQEALQLVQDRVRYVALLMGQGGYMPADASTTWSRRFGDCKGKTVLLLALLHSLGIEAEPLLVQSSFGDAIHDRLPILSYFDHVLVRAHIGGKSYYLDGTRTGDTAIDQIEVPDFGWALPVVENAQLIKLTPPPLDHPRSDTTIAIDATAGIYAPAGINADQVIRGDLAVALNSELTNLTEAQRNEFFDAYWKRSLDGLTVGASHFTFDKASRELRLTMQGKFALDWTGGFFHLPNSTIGYSPDLDRPEGPSHDAPVAVAYPQFTRTLTKIRFPAKFFPENVGKSVPEAVHATLIGVEYSRDQTATQDGMTVETRTRSLVPEVSYKDAVAASGELRALADGEVSVRLPSTYRPTAADLPELKSRSPGTAADLVALGNTLMNSHQFDDAIADFTKAIELEPKNVTALSCRALAYLWSRRLSQAQADIAKADAIDANDAVLLRARGLLAEISGQYSDAISLYSRSLAAEPNNGFALMHRGMARAALGDSTGAVADYQSASQYVPDQPENLVSRAMFEASIGKLDDSRKDLAAATASKTPVPGLALARGFVAEKSGNFKDAIQAYTDGLRDEPANANFLMRRATSYSALDDKEKALADSEAALKAGYKEVDLRLLRANIFYRQGNREATAREAEAAMSEHPQSEYAFVMAGKTYARLGMQKKALEAFDHALELNPAPYVYINRAQVRPVSDVEGQLADYDAALKLEPSETDALTGKASLLAHEGKKAEAADLYQKAAQLLPDDKDSELERAFVLYLAGRVAEAEKLFGDARTNAQTPSALNSLCWRKATAGILLNSALQDCRDALKQKPDEGAYLDSLGMVLLKLGKLDDALRAYSAAIAHKSGAGSFMGRAIVYARKGDPVHARADAAQAEKMWPDAPAVFERDYELKFELP